MRNILSLVAVLVLASCASAHGVPVLRAQVVVPYQPVLQVQSCAVQAFAAPCHVQQVQAVQVQQVVAHPVVVQQVIRQQVVHPVAVRQQVIIRQQRQQVIQRSVTRSRTIIR